MSGREYLVVVDDPDLRRRHEIRVAAGGDRDACQAAAEVALRDEWIRAPHGTPDLDEWIDRTFRGDLRAQVVAIADLWAVAWPIVPEGCRPAHGLPTERSADLAVA